MALVTALTAGVGLAIGSAALFSAGLGAYEYGDATGSRGLRAVGKIAMTIGAIGLVAPVIELAAGAVYASASASVQIGLDLSMTVSTGIYVGQVGVDVYNTIQDMRAGRADWIDLVERHGDDAVMLLGVPLGIRAYRRFGSVPAYASGETSNYPQLLRLRTGEATVFRHPGQPLHVSVEVRNAEIAQHTHQVVLSRDATVTRIMTVADVSPGPVVGRPAMIVLPEAEAALARQSALLELENLGLYDRVTNSCVSHVCDILRSGGVVVPEPEGSAQLRFLLALLKKG